MRNVFNLYTQRFVRCSCLKTTVVSIYFDNTLEALQLTSKLQSQERMRGHFQVRNERDTGNIICCR